MHFLPIVWPGLLGHGDIQRVLMEVARSMVAPDVGGLRAFEPVCCCRLAPQDLIDIMQRSACWSTPFIWQKGFITVVCNPWAEAEDEPVVIRPIMSFDRLPLSVQSDGGREPQGSEDVGREMRPHLLGHGQLEPLLRMHREPEIRR